ncbi:MAG: GDSL-type esterase/lipase family protein [Kiritimatiellales bacterium]
MKRAGYILAAGLLLGSGGVFGMPVPDIDGLPTLTTGIVQPFEDGDRVEFIGDSITEWGAYAYTVSAYYQTRFPQKDIRFFFHGRGGYTAGQWLQHMDVLLTNRPTVATIMIGMNDSGYKDPWNLPVEQRQQRLDHIAAEYKSSMDELIARLQAGGVKRIILILSSPYDETQQQAIPPFVGENEFMRDVFGSYLLAKSRELREPLMDFNTPMLKINQIVQSEDAGFSLADKGDRIHPVRPGHAVMGWLFLAYQGLDGLVSDIEIDAKNLKVLRNVDCMVSGLKNADGVLSWTASENALPFPSGVCANPEILQQYDWGKRFRFSERFNQELLQVSDLARGTYQLKIDDHMVGKHTAEQLSDGINLAENSETPQYRQALAVNRWYSEEGLYPPDSAYGYWMYKWNSDEKLDRIHRALTPVPHRYQLIPVR